jgi:hypothetical protein
MRRARRVLRALRDMLYGATIWEMVRDLQKERAGLERLFSLLVFGDLLGVPILPAFYSLRLLPHILPRLDGLRAGLFRERDITDLCDQEIT